MGMGCRPGHSLTLAPGLRVTAAGPAHCAGPRQATPAGPAGTPSADPAGRPADRRERRSSENENKVRTAPPGHLLPLAWLDASKPFVSCRGRARPAPWTRKACIHSPSSLPPEPPIPPDWRCHPSCGPQLKFGGKGGLRAPCGKDYPPNPPLRSGQINWGVRGHGRPLH